MLSWRERSFAGPYWVSVQPLERETGWLRTGSPGTGISSLGCEPRCGRQELEGGKRDVTEGRSSCHPQTICHLLSHLFGDTLSPVRTSVSRKLSSHRGHEPRGRTFLEDFFRQCGKSCSSLCPVPLHGDSGAVPRLCLMLVAEHARAVHGSWLADPASGLHAKLAVQRQVDLCM